MESEHTECREISNMCSFSCYECEKVSRGWLPWWRHYSEMHKTKKLHSADTHKLITRTVIHVCKICAENVLCDNIFVKNHLTKHKMKISEYKKLIKQHPSKILPDVEYSNTIIGNLCIYECQTCKQEFTSRTLFTRHLNELSHGKVIDISLNFKKKVFHECKLCGTTILCDNNILHGHFRYKHAMKPSDYCKQTGCTMDKIREFPIDFLKSLKQSKVIINSCEFACNVCGIKFNNLNYFKYHFKKHRGQQLSKPLTTYLTKALSYQCEKCHKWLLCDVSKIRDHWKSAHKFNLKQKLSSASTHETEYNKLWFAFTQKTPTVSNISEYSVAPVSSFSLHLLTSRIGNLCIFTCPNCSETQEFKSFYDLNEHSKNIHKKRIKYNQNLVAVARYHACLICPKAVLSDRYFLKAHVVYWHKLNLEKYINTFRQNGGEVLPTFQEWKRQKTYSTHRKINQ